MSFCCHTQVSSFLRAPNGNISGGVGAFGDSIFGVSPHNPLSSGLSQSPLLSSLGGNGTTGSGAGNGNSSVEIQRLRDELLTNRAKLASWEEGVAQARSACQAWKREADEAKGKAQLSEQARDEVSNLFGAFERKSPRGFSRDNPASV